MPNFYRLLKTWLGRCAPTRQRDVEPPLRAELFNVEQLARHAQALAQGHHIITRHKANQLLTRLEQNEHALRAFNRATHAVSTSRRITPAAEWLLDNFYLIEEQIQMARRHLPRAYSRELPRIAKGPTAGLPRIYDIVLELISHVDAQIDEVSLSAFIASYQTQASLTLGELWAIPIMLRLGLIENLKRVTTRLTLAREDRDLADCWVDRLQTMAETNPARLVIVVAEMEQAEIPLSSSFVAEICQRLSRQSPVLHLARSWLEQRLLIQGLDIEQLVQLESQNQAADQVSVSHSISSLRLLSAMDWKQFVETLSGVEHILLTDPARVYATMEFGTRDRYRHAVEFFARHSSKSESQVAQAAISLAQVQVQTKGPQDRTAHVGYYLVGKGVCLLGKATDISWPLSSLMERARQRFPMTLYGGAIGALTMLCTTTFVLRVSDYGIQGWRRLLLSLLFLLCASQLGVAVINWLSSLLVRPTLLPRIDFKNGISPACRTMVAVPTMLTHPEGVDRLLETLEIHYLANRDAALHFALLTDFADAPSESLPADTPLLKRVCEGILALNRKYTTDTHSRFFLFHRPRRWNATENVWMGYERKRGKLAEFNALLRGGARDCFSTIIGDFGTLPPIKYVITLDTDTLLPRDAARQLVGTMAHPLNHPEFDESRGVVTEGYGILQPRVGVSLPSSRRSWFVRLFASEAGIDPYTRAISDVYQDLFQEGSFIGKGIYDVDAFQRAMAGHFPENTVLSHDLLEACHARSGLVTDVEFYEDYPSRYNVDIDRRHRWIRGDWQITQWLLPRVPGSDASKIANPLSVLSQWKIFDNLRRSLIPAGLMLLILVPWLLVPEQGMLGLLSVLLVISLPTLLSTLHYALRKPADLPIALHLKGLTHSCLRQTAQLLLTLAFLPYDAFISLDAIGKSLLRILVTHRCLLQWKTSGDSERTGDTGLLGFYRTMWVPPITALSLGCYLLVTQGESVFWLLPLLGLWLCAPWTAWRISQPIESTAPKLDATQRAFLEEMARRTWHYFERFVTARENALPPDNFQTAPAPTIATRTSPTNMGLALLANLAAHDFGYLSTGTLLQRTQDTLSTMQALEKYRGHFYNWYETRTLAPLQPLYVSSVDSGNLAGHLLTLSAGLRELADSPIFSTTSFSGLRTTLRVLRRLCPQYNGFAVIEQDFLRDPKDLNEAQANLLQAEFKAQGLVLALAHESEDLRTWSQCLLTNIQDHLQDLRCFAPWLNQPTTAGPSDPVAPIASHPNNPSLRALAQDTHESSAEAIKRLNHLERLALQCEQMAAMDFSFIFDKARDLFCTGFNVAERRCDLSFYDLLASEARLTSYVAIALGQVHQDHWFSMGRLLVAARGEVILVSWSGSMFEYLMPLLVMPTYEHTLLDHTCKIAVEQQIAYGLARHVPWGISESGYHRTDVQLNYQYRAFGVPGLGLKRGLGEDLVIAPYSSALALMVNPTEACKNLQRLATEGRFGNFGFYEAIDYTATRLAPGETEATIYSFMAHHQGMSLLSVDNVLHDFPMQRRFMACPQLKAADLLLQERMPKTAASVCPTDLVQENARALSTESEGLMRVYTNPSPPAPEAHLLSNGRYHVAVTSAGGGYSRWRDLAVTRWREDSTRDCWGTFVFLRDLETGEYWSTAYQPTLQPTKGYEAIFTQARAEFRHQHAGLEVHTEISISPEDDLELRRVRITNRSSVQRVIEVTSYAEVVLAPASADAAHPAFSNLFVQTEFLKSSNAILCTRRPRSETEQPPVLLHLMLGQGTEIGELSCETDRDKFLGRGGNLRQPAAFHALTPLSNTVGPVLDPVISLRRTMTLQPHESALIDLMIGVAENRTGGLAMIEKYQSPRMGDRVFDMAWTHSQVTLRHLNVSEGEAQIFCRLAGALLYADPARRAKPGIMRTNRRGQSSLWSYGISGDTPLVLLSISDVDKIELVRQLVQAHAYWRMKGLAVELVILNEDTSLYRQSLHERIIALISSGMAAPLIDKPGGIFVRRLEQVAQEDRILLQSLARIVLDDEHGSLAEQLEHRSVIDALVPLLLPTRAAYTPKPASADKRELILENGLGGFTRDGHEYVITLEPGKMTPAPWVNVIANPSFGTVVSESGGSYTWLENSHEFRLSPWNNDAVQDSSGEAFYLRDEQTGQYWSPTPLPARGTGPYTIRHGFGYTVFEHTEAGIVSEFWIYVAMDAPVKFMVLRLRNVSGRPRQLSATGYFEWVLGEQRDKTQLHVQTEIDPKTGALLARNFYNTEFPDRIAFIDTHNAGRTLTGDRKEFLGRNGNLSQPAALRHTRLSGKVGPALDPCGAVQVPLELADGEEREVCFRLGVGRDEQDVQNLVSRFRRADASTQALQGVWAYWNRTLGSINVDTPDPAVNVMANGWLLYQTLSCRLWGRTGFYQSGGAYGFRDQLQDVMALVHAEPGLTRAHLLLAAARQFREGDVQHWWHPPKGRGVRTHFSDDFLWLAFATCRYVTCVADTGVLDELVPFLEARAVKPDEEAYYDLPARSEETATLYQHCVRAIEHGLRFGEHGLPLIGCGDWNDGMNRVGHEGRGESVWLAFFLHTVLTQFAPLATRRGDAAFALRCLTEAARLKTNIEAQAWDGAWYRRAYFDSGEPLGSQLNPECRIDALPQAWAVLSGAADPARSRQAMESVNEQLVHRDTGLIQLFTPPFNTSALNPGYIKGYIPGVRENGGQYTHGAIWCTMAFALLGQHDRAWELFALLNPVTHGQGPEKIARYKVEPYVVAADIYALPPHEGRGGWTWYTGSAGWMYRLLLETLLGAHLEGAQLRLSPCMPSGWAYYKIHYRYRNTVYHITLTRVTSLTQHEPALTLDGAPLQGCTIPLCDDQREHHVELRQT